MKATRCGNPELRKQLRRRTHTFSAPIYIIHSSPSRLCSTSAIPDVQCRGSSRTYSHDGGELCPERTLEVSGGITNSCLHNWAPPSHLQINWILLISRQGKVRLAKWFTTLNPKTKSKIVKDVTQLVLARRTRMCNFLEYKDSKVVYRRYASLFFVTGISQGDNELITLEIIHRYVEILDRYFGNVSVMASLPNCRLSQGAD